MAQTAAHESPEIYHVQFADNDVHRMSLEKLDDCFRLGVINETTLVWTDGMPEWQTLAQVAGLNEPEPLSPPPAPCATRRPKRPKPSTPPSRRPVTRKDAGWRLPALPPVPTLPPSRRHEASAGPVAGAPVAPSFTAPVAEVAPGPGASAWPPGSAVPASVLPEPVTTAIPLQAIAPVAASPAPAELDGALLSPRAEWRSRIQWALMLGTLLAGALITLYRTDALLAGAESLNLGSSFLELEQRWLGGPPDRVPRQTLPLVQPAAGR
jgi:hypothetical protein